MRRKKGGGTCKTTAKITVSGCIQPWVIRQFNFANIFIVKELYLPARQNLYTILEGKAKWCTGFDVLVKIQHTCTRKECYLGTLARVRRTKCKYVFAYLHFILPTLANGPLSSIPFLYRFVTLALCIIYIAHRRSTPTKSTPTRSTSHGINSHWDQLPPDQLPIKVVNEIWLNVGSRGVPLHWSVPLQRIVHFKEMEM